MTRNQKEASASLGHGSTFTLMFPCIAKRVDGIYEVNQLDTKNTGRGEHDESVGVGGSREGGRERRMAASVVAVAPQKDNNGTVIQIHDGDYDEGDNNTNQIINLTKVETQKYRKQREVSSAGENDRDLKHRRRRRQNNFVSSSPCSQKQLPPKHKCFPLILDVR
eukprot:GHVS01061575.1.p1 GENE.GHVS01061575.1~~GHVS01061575.1.p1  ORF type:complete len:165 (-),score=34.04 GHVS01061575.1:114-608(-)